MTNWNLPWKATCRCERVELAISEAPIMTMACHCTGCQRMTASAFSLSATIPAAGFAIAKGEPVIGGLHGASKHYFCDHCKSWMFTRPEGLDAFVNVRSTLIHGHADLEPFVETLTDEKLPWATTPAKHSYGQYPAPESYPQLMAEFADYFRSRP
ncbi:GFA family protein [soil metagenome]